MLHSSRLFGFQLRVGVPVNRLAGSLLSSDALEQKLINRSLDAWERNGGGPLCVH